MRERDQATKGLLKRATCAAIFVSATLILVKLFAWLATGSVVLQATLMDSFLDMLASTINFFAVRHALKPADYEHRFGHGKIEALANIGQSAFITGSGVFILLESGRTFLNPTVLRHFPLSIGVMVFSIFATFFLFQYQRYVVRKTGSLAIQGDALHYQSDLLINVGALVALFLTCWLDIPYIDPLCGAIIALYILWGVFGIVRQALDVLMDRELPDDKRQDIISLIMGHPDVQGFRDLRTRSAGSQYFVQLQLELLPHLSLTVAHRISHEVEDLIKGKYPNADIIIHQDIKT